MNLRSLLLALLFPGAAFGLGTRIADQDAHATARANAFAATADNPSAIYYNPAGLSQLEGTHLSLGAYGLDISARSEFEDPERQVRNRSGIQAAPQFYLAHKPLESRLTLGLGVYSPFGLGVEYPDDAPFRTLAKEGRLLFVTINPVVSFQLTPTLSLAAGATLNQSKIKLSRGIFIPGDNFEFEGTGTGYGFNAGLLWKPHPKHAFGLTYRSSTDLDYSGHSHLSIPAYAVPTPFGPFAVPRTQSEEDADLSLHFPQSVVLGYSFRPSENWNLEINVDWTDWDSLNTPSLSQSRSARVALPFNWESSCFYEFGVTRQLPRGFSVSAGYLYSENSVPNESFNPLIPDSNRHVFCVGFGRQGPHTGWDIAYEYALGPDRSIANATPASGTYHIESHALTVRFAYRF